MTSKRERNYLRLPGEIFKRNISYKRLEKTESLIYYQQTLVQTNNPKISHNLREAGKL